jgi:formylglycine-generating enzyme required for sulfatase activity
MKLTCVGRADLLAVLQKYGREGLEQAAECMGFFRRPEKPSVEKPVIPTTDTAGPAGPAAEPTVEHRFETEVPEVRFWRAVEYREKAEPGERGVVPDWLKEMDEFAGDDLLAKPGKLPPAKRPLLPWSQLWPFLFAALGLWCDARSIDMRRVIENISRLEPLRRLPRRRRLTWAGNAQLILDTDERLMLFREDRNNLLHRLKRWRGKSGFEVIVFDSGPGGLCKHWPKGMEEPVPYRFPLPGTPVLIISDLGCLDRDRDNRVKKSWLRFGKRMNRAGFVPTILAPCPPRLLDPRFSIYFHLACWDRGGRLKQKGVKSVHGTEWSGAIAPVEDSGTNLLLALLSFAVRVEPALLRAVRLLMPHRMADVGTEAAAWNHHDVFACPEGFTFHPETVNNYRHLFKDNKDIRELRARVSGLVKRFHDHLSEAIQAEEELLANTLLKTDETDKEEPGGHRFMKRVVKTLFNEGFIFREGLGNWMNRVGLRMHPEAWDRYQAVAAAWLLNHLQEFKQGRLIVPQGMDIGKAAWVLGRDVEPKEFLLRRKGNVFIADRGRDDSSADEWLDRGCPLVTLNSARSWLTAAGADIGQKGIEMFSTDSPQPIRIPVPGNGRVIVDTDMAQVVLEPFTLPGWAAEIRQDQCGLSALVREAKKERRVCWLKPGKYPVFSTGGTKDGSRTVFISKGCWMEEGVFNALREKGFAKPAWADTFGVDEYGIYADFSIKKVAQRMRLILPGRFIMGSPAGEPDRYEWETLHEVILTRGFWLADTACTQALWQAVMGKNPVEFKGGRRPVEKVSWEDCLTFIEKINRKKPDLHLRFPSEAEWEYACRAGTGTPFWFGDNITPDQVNYNGNYPYAEGEKGEYRGRTVEVKSLPCNEWGLYQMHGNVWEWCADWYGDYPEGPVIDPTGPDSGESRVLRGGSWVYYGRHARSAYRDGSDPSGRWHLIGLRLARSQA